jgi:soluble lytic murein transglycosylase-like protein
MNKRFIVNRLISVLNYWVSVFIISGILIFPEKIYNGTNSAVADSMDFKIALPRTIITAHITTDEDKIAADSNHAITKVQETADLKTGYTDNQAKPGYDPQDKKYTGPFDMLIFQAAELYQVDPALIKAIIMAESGYNPKAISKKGAKGLMQLMPKTAKWLGVVDSFNPEHNINGGVRYFKQLLKQFDGDVKLALAAYNAGSRKVRQYNGVPPFKATKFYITKVFKYYDIYKKQSI